MSGVTPAGLWATASAPAEEAYSPRFGAKVPSISEMRIMTTIRPNSPTGQYGGGATGEQIANYHTRQRQDDATASRQIPRPPSGMGSRPTSATPSLRGKVAAAAGAGSAGHPLYSRPSSSASRPISAMGHNSKSGGNRGSCVRSPRGTPTPSDGGGDGCGQQEGSARFIDQFNRSDVSDIIVPPTQPGGAWLKRPPVATPLMIRQERFASPRVRTMITAPTLPASRGAAGPGAGGVKMPRAGGNNYTARIDVNTIPSSSSARAPFSVDKNVGARRGSIGTKMTAASPAAQTARPASQMAGRIPPGASGMSTLRAEDEAAAGEATFRGVVIANPSVTEGTGARPTSSFAMVQGVAPARPAPHSNGVHGMSGASSLQLSAVDTMATNMSLLARRGSSSSLNVAAATTVGPSGAPLDLRRARHNPHEDTYARDEEYDNDCQTVAAQTNGALDHFEFFKARRLMRTSLPIQATSSGGGSARRDASLKAAVLEIKRERITKQNGPNKLHMNLGPDGTTDHVYIRYPYPHQPFPTPLTKWLLHMVAMQHHPVVAQLRSRFLATSLPVDGRPTFDMEALTREVVLPNAYENIFNIIDEGGEGGRRSSRRGNRQWMVQFAATRRGGGGGAGVDVPTVPPLPAETVAIANWARTAPTFRKPFSPRRRGFENDEDFIDPNDDEKIKPYPSQPREVGSDPLFFPLKLLWAKHSDYESLMGMPYSADNFKRFMVEALYDADELKEAVKKEHAALKAAAAAAAAAAVEDGTSAVVHFKLGLGDDEKASTEGDVDDDEDEEEEEYDEDGNLKTPKKEKKHKHDARFGPKPLPPPAPWSLSTPLVDPGLSEEVFFALNNMSTQRLLYPNAMLYLNLFLLRGIPAVHTDLLKVLLGIARKKMAMRRLEITPQDFYMIVLLVEQFLENCSTVPASAAHPEAAAYQQYAIKGSKETGVDVSVIHSRPAAVLPTAPVSVAAGGNAAAAAKTRQSPAAGVNTAHRLQKEETVLPKVGVPSPEAVALLRQYREDIQYFSDHMPKDNYAVHYDTVFGYFHRDSIFVAHMHADADEAVRSAMAAEADMLKALPKHSEQLPSVATMMPYAVSTWRGIDRIALQRAVLKEVADNRVRNPPSSGQSVKKSGAQSYLERPPCML